MPKKKEKMTELTYKLKPLIKEMQALAEAKPDRVGDLMWHIKVPAPKFRYMVKRLDQLQKLVEWYKEHHDHIPPALQDPW